MTLHQLVYRLGSAALFLIVALPILWLGVYYMMSAGVDHTLHTYNLIPTYDPETGGYSVVPLRMGLEFVALPLAALAAARLRWGAECIGGARESRVGWLLPLLGAVVVAGMFWFIGWFWQDPQYLFGIHLLFGVQRWIAVAIAAAVGYLGVILFPRLTAAMAGAVAGPALFAVVGYTLFPSFIKAASDRDTITDAEARLADTLTIVFFWGVLAVAIAAILSMVVSRRLRQHPLSHAVWAGALMLFMTVSGTFNGWGGDR